MTQNDSDSQNPSNDDGRGKDDTESESQTENKTKIKARSHNQEVEIESYEASAEELTELAKNQLEFQFREARRGELIQLEEESRHPLFSRGDD